MLASSSYGRRAQSAVMPSIGSPRRAGRMRPRRCARRPSRRPTCTGRSTANACQSRVVEPGRAAISSTHDRVGLAEQCRGARRVTSPRMRTARPGPGNGCRLTMPRGRPELAAERAHLVLEELAQRLDQLKLHALGQAADVVVALDRRRRPLDRDALDHVRVQRALGEEARVAVLLAAFVRLEDVDELVADDLALLLGVFDARERIEEALRGVDACRSARGSGRGRSLDLLRLALRAAGRCPRRCTVSCGPMAL